MTEADRRGDAQHGGNDDGHRERSRVGVFGRRQSHVMEQRETVEPAHASDERANQIDEQ